MRSIPNLNKNPVATTATTKKIHPLLVEELIFEDDKGTTTQNK